MRNRFARVCVIVVLLAAGAAAAYVARERFLSPASTALASDAQVDRLLVLISDLSRSEAAYVAPGQDPAPALERVPALLGDVTALTAEISRTLVSPRAVTELQAFADATSRLAEADAAAREQLLVGDVLTASHLLHGKAAEAAGEMTATLARVREEERAARLAAGSNDARTVLMALAGAAGVWVVGLLVLAFVPGGQASRAFTAEGDTRSILTRPDSPGSVDLSAAADLCTDLGRVETTPELHTLLARAQALLGAAGVIVWIEARGELFAAVAVGYPREQVARVAPIRHDDVHPTAAAWREERTQTVAASGASHAAIAVPLFSGTRCHGVFAVELEAGQAQRPATRDVARMIAAQLSVVVGSGAAAAETTLATGTGS